MEQTTMQMTYALETGGILSALYEIMAYLHTDMGMKNAMRKAKVVVILKGWAENSRQNFWGRQLKEALEKARETDGELMTGDLIARINEAVMGIGAQSMSQLMAVGLRSLWATNVVAPVSVRMAGKKLGAEVKWLFGNGVQYPVSVVWSRFLEMMFEVDKKFVKDKVIWRGMNGSTPAHKGGYKEEAGRDKAEWMGEIVSTWVKNIMEEADSKGYELMGDGKVGRGDGMSGMPSSFFPQYFPPFAPPFVGQFSGQGGYQQQGYQAGSAGVGWVLDFTPCGVVNKDRLGDCLGARVAVELKKFLNIAGRFEANPEAGPGVLVNPEKERAPKYSGVANKLGDARYCSYCGYNSSHRDGGCREMQRIKFEKGDAVKFVCQWRLEKQK